MWAAKMSCEADSKMEVDEKSDVATINEAPPESFKDKYRQLKAKLKYLVCVSSVI